MSEDVMLKLSELLEFRLSVLRLEVCAVMRVLKSNIEVVKAVRVKILCTEIGSLSSKGSTRKIV